MGMAREKETCEQVDSSRASHIASRVVCFPLEALSGSSEEEVQKGRKLAAKALRTSTIMASPGLLGGPMGALLGRLGPLLGRPGALSGRLGRLGPSGGALGAPLGPRRGPLWPSCGYIGPPGGPLGPPGGPLGSLSGASKAVVDAVETKSDDMQKYACFPSKN